MSVLELKLLDDDQLQRQLDWVIKFNKPNAPVIKRVLKEIKRRKGLT